MRYFLILWAFLSISFASYGQKFELAFGALPDLLAAHPNSIHTHAFVLGRDYANDGGGGQFYYDSASSSPTNTGTIFKPNDYSGRWIRVVPDRFEVNAAWFGAKPDDGLNDSPAIQDAADYCYQQKHGTVVCNGGVFNLGQTIYIPYRVNLIGKDGWRLTELLAATPTSNFYMLGGSTQFRMMDGVNLQSMIIFNSTDGYVRQPAETIEDGTTADSIFQESLVENIVLNGNPFNNTANTCGMMAFNKWNITVRNCVFINLRGNCMYWRDCNQLMIEDVTLKGGIGNIPNRGMFIYSCADSQFRGGYAFGYSGPAIWVDGASSAVNLFSDWLIGNSVVTNTTFEVTGISSGQWTLSGSPDFKTGEHVELRTTGTVPTGFSRVQLYYLYKIAENTYGMHTNYGLATNGVYLTTVDVGTGTHSVTKGPASAVYISGGANCNSFVNIRADQCSGPGFYFRNAYANSFTGGLLSQNDGVANVESIPTDDQVGVRFDLYAQNNSVVNTTIRNQTIGFQTKNGAYGNLMLGRYLYVPTQIDRQSDSANDEPVLQSGGQISLGTATNQVVMNLTGNASGVRMIRMTRADVGQTSGFGVQTGGFTFWDETGGRAVGSFSSDSSVARLKLGSASATPRLSYITGETGSGTDITGSLLRLEAGSGTGSSTAGGDIEFFTPNAGSSGSTVQGTTSKVKIRRNGQLLLQGMSTDPTINLGDGDIWHRSDLGQFKVRAFSKTYNLDQSIAGSVVWDIPSTAAQAISTTTVTVTGANAGDLVVVSPTSPAAGIFVLGDVTATDTVTIRAFNVSSGPVDPPSTTYRVKAIRQ